MTLIIIILKPGKFTNARYYNCIILLPVLFLYKIRSLSMLNKIHIPVNLTVIFLMCKRNLPIRVILYTLQLIKKSPGGIR